MTAHNPKPKLVITQGEPVTISLRYPSGKVVASLIPGAPPQMYYSLMDGRGCYLPLEVGRIIDDLKLKAGEPFTLLKAGPRDWRATRIEPKRDFYPPLPPGMQNGDMPNGPVNGSGEGSAEILARCYEKGIEIVVGAVNLAKDKYGLLLAPTFEDVRCVSTALMISETRPR